MYTVAETNGLSNSASNVQSSRRRTSTGMKVTMMWSSIPIPAGVTSRYDFSFLNKLASWK